MKISKYILVLILIWNRSILGNDRKCSKACSRKKNCLRCMAMSFLVTIRTENDCMTDNHTIIDNKYAFLIQYSPRETSLHETCSVFMANAWSIEKQNGLGVFLPRRIDCSTMIKIECLSITKYDENQVSKELRSMSRMINFYHSSFLFEEKSNIRSIYLSHKCQQCRDAMQFNQDHF